MSSSISAHESRQPGELKRFASLWSEAWNKFWFLPQDPIVLGVIRILVGCMVLYTHCAWTLELTTFFGSEGLLSSEYREHLFGNSFAWSHLDAFQSSPAWLLVIHILGMIVVVMFTVGFATRWTATLTALLVISYANRATGALFGLDQINAFLCLYLAVGNSGAALSIDDWVAHRKRSETGQGSCFHDVRYDTRTRIATRLIQIHMCVVYMFAAIGKLQGDTWFNGEAIWGAVASYEYQTLDMTWLAEHMWLVALLTLGTLTWELVYPALVWPRLTRPIILAIAIPIHIGIGLCMGMMTFGLIMLVGNMAFIEPGWFRSKLGIR